MARALAPLSCLIALGAIGAGCARGGSDRPDARIGPLDGGGVDAPSTGSDAQIDAPRADDDAGPDPIDAGDGEDATAIDAGPIELDGGPIGTDSGPIGTDSGPIGTDSGPIGTDAGHDAGCTSAAACSDGLACNGIERCEGGACVAGTAVVCDDGVTCTTNACVEPGACTYTPVDSACGAGMRCTASGCVPTGSCSESPCRLVSPQCGCAAGQGCYLAGAARVCAAVGVGSDGTACTGSSSCAAGLDCIDYSAAAGGEQCTRYCNTDSDCGGRPGALCLGQLNDGTGMPIPGVATCTASCNPVSSAGCVAGLGCAIFRETMGARRWLTECQGPVGTGVQGSPCTTDAQCARGYACDGIECLRWCRLGMPGDCPLGYTCYSLDTAAPATIGGVTYGVCAF